MRVLFIGDVVGTNGLKALKKYLPSIKQDHKINMVFLNGENAERGLGISEKNYKEFMSLGVNLVTLGNHSFAKRDILDVIDDLNIIRPCNYGSNVPGKEYKTLNYNGKKVTVINVMGRVFMRDPLDNPFEKVETILNEVESDYVFIDFHGEATSEKLAFAHYFDGKVTAVVGTHTHVPTADNLVLPKGTLYITDIGMTGSLYGILGTRKEIVIDKFIDGMPRRLMEDTSDKLQFNAVVLDTDLNKITKINIFE